MMDSRKNLKDRIIDKILASQNEALLSLIDKLISSSEGNNDQINLSPEQRELLRQSDRDLQEDAVITQEELDEADLAWLLEK